MFRHRAKTQNSNLAYSTKPFFLPFPALTLRRKILRYPLKDFISESIRFERLELFERLERFERLVEGEASAPRSQHFETVQHTEMSVVSSVKFSATS